MSVSEGPQKVVKDVAASRLRHGYPYREDGLVRVGDVALCGHVAQESYVGSLTRWGETPEVPEVCVVCLDLHLAR